jgi:hypothetical protein
MTRAKSLPARAVAPGNVVRATESPFGKSLNSARRGNQTLSDENTQIGMNHKFAALTNVQTFMLIDLIDALRTYEL